ncbi:MAG TPA: hypothetical protein VH813_02645 [Candidatus Limnocylindrales bacterium]|jgi:hypothetical protein
MGRTQRGRVILGLMLLALGMVWIGQGSGFLPGRSFMVDDLRWAFAGGVVAAAGILILLLARRRRREE